MQRRIQALPPQLANQIAAGEVVERPASVVKELLENSIDAGASAIELEVEQGGAKLIRVLDDGRGIHPEDLPLAIAPHATSKVYTQQELEQIASLGFRGEALASIASVSRLSLASRHSDAGQGWALSAAGELAPSAQPAGTRVEVRDLFYNTPARRKFLRTERTEFLHIEEVVRRLALSRFDVAITLRHNGRQVLRLRPAQDEAAQRRRAGEVLGRGFIQQALALRFEAAGMHLQGWLAPPSASRSQADSQYFYLNGRMIRDKLINHAVRQAHQGLLEPGRYPAYVLYLSLDPTQVDVNVHPTKHEVRFRESRMVHDFLFRALQETLSGEQAAPGAELESPAAASAIPARSNYSAETASPLRGRAPSVARVADQQSFYARARDAALPRRRVRAILHGRFLLADGEEGPQLLDLAAARRQVLLQHLRVMVEQGEVRSQPLLLPYSENLTSGQLERLLRLAPAALPLGVELEQLGEEAVVLRRIPALLRGVAPAKVLQTLMEAPDSADGAVTEWLSEALVALTVNELPLEDLDQAQRLLQQLEALPAEQQVGWRSLSLGQLERWAAATPVESL
ncbi:MAG: DNA mismatch repair endonuclease MutL [Pseudomonadota bacterium]